MVQYLPRTCSYHVPVFITVKKNVNVGSRYFKFFDLWVEHKDFKVVVKNAREEEVNGNAMWRLHQKKMNICTKLSEWSRQVFGDIYKEPRRLEQEIANLKNIQARDDIPDIRAEVNEEKAKHIQFLKLQDSVLRQKAKANWLKEGDKNIAYFHSMIKGRRKKLNIQKIQDEDRLWREGNDKITEETVQYFQKNLWAQGGIR